jgi:hypothetical protein
LPPERGNHRCRDVGVGRVESWGRQSFVEHLHKAHHDKLVDGVDGYAHAARFAPVWEASWSMAASQID